MAGSAATEAPPGMVLVPGGKFLYGQEKKELTIGPFFIDVAQVTNAEWRVFVDKGGGSPLRHWPGDLEKEKREWAAIAECPVIWVRWDEAEAYAKFVEKELPTPEQWEKAARGPDGNKYAWGSEFDPGRVNTKEAGHAKPVPTKTLKRSKSPYGALGLGGNVQEWTSGFADRDKRLRVVKGGSYRQYLGAASWQYDMDPAKPQDCIGFRCVKNLPAE